MSIGRQTVAISIPHVAIRYCFAPNYEQTDNKIYTHNKLTHLLLLCRLSSKWQQQPLKQKNMDASQSSGISCVCVCLVVNCAPLSIIRDESQLFTMHKLTNGTVGISKKFNHPPGMEIDGEATDKQQANKFEKFLIFPYRSRSLACSVDENVGGHCNCRLSAERKHLPGNWTSATAIRAFHRRKHSVR